MDPTPGAAMLRRGLGIVRREVALHPVPFLVAVFGAAVYAVASVATSAVLARIVDQVITPRFDGGAFSARSAALAAAAIVGVGVARAAGVVLRRTAASIAQASVRTTLAGEVVDRMQAQPLAWLRERPSGELLAHAHADPEAATEVLGPLPFATGVVVLVVVAATWLFASDWVLGLVALVVFPTLVAVNVVYQRRVATPAERAQDLVGSVTAAAHESLEGALVIKVLGAEEREAERFADRAGHLRDAKVHVAHLRAGFEATLDAVPALATVLVVVVGAWRIQEGAVTVGTLVGAVSLFTLMIWPLRLIGFVLGDLPRSVAGWNRIEAILALPARPEAGAPEAAGAGAGAGAPARVEAQGVTVAHGGARPVLADVSFTVRPGATVALVGPTGAGKTTLLLVLAGLLAPDEGRVVLDDAPADGLDPVHRAGRVAIAFQDPFLFGGTVAQNVDVAGTLAPAGIVETLRRADADRFVADLPHGAATRLGERGATLSGGQRQRIALARALARTPGLLLLDDATSSVDPVTEGRILSRLTRPGGPTVVLVASRAAAIALADEVLFLRKGRLVARGPHQQLLEEVPAYRHLVEAYQRDRHR
ncbi:MAG: ABC transporter ATP-binding protein [Acidimicrobiales bacterium]|nr:ABC transporter ATP-binding protein [Acidimicrobiales bacterium]